jgi:glycosyltransferase involved in cell wall biosynthesis
MEISIVIPTLNRPDDLEKTLSSLLELSQKPTQTLIIDQSDNGDTKHLIENKKYEPLHINYHHSRIKSLSKARNLGIKELKPDIDLVLFLDDDVLLEADFLNQMENFFASHPKAKGGVANISSPSRKITTMKKI